MGMGVRKALKSITFSALITKLHFYGTKGPSPPICMVQYSIPCSGQFFKSQNQKLGGLRKKYCRVAALRDHPFKSSFFHIFFALSRSYFFALQLHLLFKQCRKNTHEYRHFPDQHMFGGWKIFYICSSFFAVKKLSTYLLIFFFEWFVKKNYLRLSICYNTVCI